MNSIDKVINYFAPRMGVKRARARLALQLAERYQRKYEGASTGRRTEGWRTAGSSANAEIVDSIEKLRARHRALVRDNAYAAAAVRGIAHNMIGTGLTPHFETGSKGRTKQIEQIAVDHLDTPAIDADGVHDLYGLQNLWAKTIAESGSVLVRRRSRRPSDGLPLPFQLQTLEPDYLDRSKDGPLRNGGRIIGGKEYDPLGRLVQFWLYPEHPGEVTRLRGFQSKPVPASEIAHIYRMDRPGQVDGVPWGAPIIIKLRDFDEYEDGQLYRQKIAAAFAAFVEDSEIGIGQDTPTQQKSDDPLIDRLEPGIIEYLPPGKRITFGTPPSVEGYGEFSKISLHAVAAGFGVTYELLTGDLEGVNFSSGRMGWLEFHRNLTAWRWHMMLPMGCRPVIGWFLTTAELAGYRTAGAKTSWGIPRREMIDPTKEVPANRDRVRSGQSTLFGMLKEEGVDPRAHLLEIKASNDFVDELELILDSDPRKTTRNGNLVNDTQGTTNDQTDPQVG